MTLPRGNTLTLFPPEPVSFSKRLEAAHRAAGCDPIESGFVGRLADNECPCGRLPGDKSEPCGCWQEESAA